jgi:hypothetical protein
LNKPAKSHRFEGLLQLGLPNVIPTDGEVVTQRSLKQDFSVQGIPDVSTKLMRVDVFDRDTMDQTSAMLGLHKAPEQIEQ